MATKHLKLEPHSIDDNAWWYELSDGIEIVMRFPMHKPRMVRISWRQLRAALKRKDRKE